MTAVSNLYTDWRVRRALRKKQIDFIIEQRRDPPDFYFKLSKAMLNEAQQELNSSEDHFLLELIQNADDSSYDTKETPFLKFTIGNEIVETFQNEKGFTFADVDSLCSSGMSSKKELEDTIGEKGLGFKSIFAIFHKVIIVSNGFSFSFDVARDLGTIVPEWREEEQYNKDSKGTTMYLYPKETSFLSKSEQILNIEPFCLLFLRKLKRLEFSFSNKDRYTRTIEKSPTGQQHKVALVECCKGKETRKEFLLYDYWIRDIKDIKEKRRQNISSTAIQMAFPYPTPKYSAMETFKTYAFLPINDFNFKFLIQANFVLSTSREEIRKDSDWNNLIMDNLYQCLLGAFTTFQSIDPLFINYFGKLDQVHELFKIHNLHGKMMAYFAATSCILDSSNTLRKAADLVRDKHNSSEFISNNTLYSSCGKFFVHPTVEENCLDVLKALEIEHIKVESIASIANFQNE